MELKKVPLNDVHEKLGAKMVPFAGFIMPVRYSSDLDEHMTVRNGVGVFDVSHMGEFTIKGPQALDLIQRATSKLFKSFLVLDFTESVASLIYGDSNGDGISDARDQGIAGRRKCFPNRRTG